MREVKFRGKQENGQWVYGDNFALCHDCYIRTKIKDEFNPSQWVKVDYKTVGQYTGIKDQFGQEIYEKDIVLDYAVIQEGDPWNIGKEEPAVYIVEFLNGSFMLIPLGDNNVSYAPAPIHIEDLSEDAEILGNYYDNPELL